MSAAVQSEKWVLTDESTNDFDVTESAMVVYRCVVEFLNDVSLVMSDDVRGFILFFWFGLVRIGSDWRNLQGYFI